LTISTPEEAPRVRRLLASVQYALVSINYQQDICGDDFRRCHSHANFDVGQSSLQPVW
jgi:hypothetical protein